MEAVLFALKPLLDVVVLQMLVPALGLYVAFLGQKYLGLVVDDKRQKDLASALETGWKRAFAENATDPSVETVISHVRSVGAPQAVKHFDLSDNDLRAIAPARKSSAREKWLKDAA